MKKSSQQFYFNHILDTIRNLGAKIYETSGVQKARHLHDFVTKRTLKVFVKSDDNSFDPTSFIHTNVIVFSKDKTVSLVENHFKTVQSAGPRNINLSDDHAGISLLFESIQYS